MSNAGQVRLYLIDEKRRKKIVIGGTKGLEAPMPLSVSLNFTKAPFTCFRIHKKGDSGYTGLPYITEDPKFSKRSQNSCRRWWIYGRESEA